MSRLRDYQLSVVSAVSKALDDHKRIVVSCPTGSGKTMMTLRGIAAFLPKPVLWITHRRELAKQVRDYRADVSVRMVQASTPITEPAASIIIDEGHHVCAGQYRTLFSNYPGATFVALTATPYRMDGVGLGSCGFSKIIHGPDVLELTERRFLCPARVLVPASESQGSWTPTAAARQIKSHTFHKAIVYCRSVADAITTAEQLNAIGLSSSAVHGELPAKARHKAERAYRSGKTKVVCNHTIFTEGYDVPSTDLVALNRFTESRCLWRQMTGRGLRIHNGKTSCIVLDLAGNAILHGSIYDKEIFDLSGHVESTEARTLSDVNTPQDLRYTYNPEQPLKEWKPSPKPVSIRESLQRLKSRSPLHRFLTA
jgi:DNA repair protein RadD